MASRASLAQRRIWSDLHMRARKVEALTRAGARPETKRRLSEATRRSWADPALRARRAEAIKRGWAAAKERRAAAHAKDVAPQLLLDRRGAYLPKPASERRRIYQVRQCIACPQMFRSQGPHNRQCPNCRRRPENPFEP